MNSRKTFEPPLYVPIKTIARSLGVSRQAVHKRASAEQHRVLASCGAVHSFLTDFIALTKRLFSRRRKKQ